MGDDDIVTAFGHVVLAGVATKALTTAYGPSFTHAGVHANYLLHGLTGGLYFMSASTGFNIQPLYTISKQAVQYLAIPSLLADIYYDEKYLSAAHFASGVLPFVFAVSGNDSPQLVNFATSVNIISLCYYAIKNNCDEYAWYAAGSAIVTYFGLSYVNALFPIGLAITEYFIHKLYSEKYGPLLTPKERKELNRQKKEAARKKKEREKAAQKAAKAAAQRAKAREKAKLKECKKKK